MALDKATELKNLHDLKNSGVLSDDEFASQKDRILKMGYDGKEDKGFSDKSWTTALIFSIFGFERFYLGYIGLGIAKVLTGFGFGIWWLVDLISVVRNKMPDSEGRKLKK